MAKINITTATDGFLQKVISGDEIGAREPFGKTFTTITYLWNTLSELLKILKDAENPHKSVVMGFPRKREPHWRNLDTYTDEPNALLVLDFDFDGQPDTPKKMRQTLPDFLSRCACVVQMTSSHQFKGNRYRFFFQTSKMITIAQQKIIAVNCGGDTTIYSREHILFTAKPTPDPYGMERFVLLSGIPDVQVEDTPEEKKQIEITTVEAQEDTDEEILKKITGEFRSLFEGHWKSKYPSQSEADSALMTLLKTRTQNTSQLMRLFRLSALGQRDKAKRDDYLMRTIKNAPQPFPTMSFDHFLSEPVKPIEKKKRYIPTEYPPGTAGELAKWIHRNSIRPVVEASIAATLGLLAGIAGRAYNCSNTGLNIFIIYVAPTGRGKEAISTAINRVFGQLVMDETLPGIASHMGSSDFSSGQAMLKEISKHPCCVSVFSEFAYALTAMCDPRAPSHQAMRKKVLLDLFSKSGDGNVLLPYSYADSEKSTNTVNSPAFSFVAESATKVFFENINESHIQDGLLPRFLVVQYDGPREYMQDKPPTALPFDVYESLRQIAENSIRYLPGKAHYVGMEPDAADVLRELDISTTDAINESSDTTDDELLNRVHLLSIRVSALLAVADEPANPVINMEHVRWSIDFVQGCFDQLRKQFSKGEIGENCSNDIVSIRKAIDEYMSMSPDKRIRSKRASKEVSHMEGVIPLTFLQWRILRLKRFSRMGNQGLQYLEKLVNTMVREGALVYIQNERQTLFGKGPCW